MIAGTLSPAQIVEKQGGYHFGLLPHWYVFTPWDSRLHYLSNRFPCRIESFSLRYSEAESELIAGHLTEYSGFKYALFFLAEYLGMFAVSGPGCDAVPGRVAGTTSGIDWVPSYLVFRKLITIVLLFIWYAAQCLACVWINF